MSAEERNALEEAYDLETLSRFVELMNRKGCREVEVRYSLAGENGNDGRDWTSVTEDLTTLEPF